MKQAIRPITPGRKSNLFFDTNEGAENNAINYTLIACFKEACIQIDEGNPFKTCAKYEGGGTHKNTTFK